MVLAGFLLYEYFQLNILHFIITIFSESHNRYVAVDFLLVVLLLLAEVFFLYRFVFGFIDLVRFFNFEEQIIQYPSFISIDPTTF